MIVKKIAVLTIIYLLAFLYFLNKRIFKRKMLSLEYSKRLSLTNMVTVCRLLNLDEDDWEVIYDHRGTRWLIRKK